MSPILHDWKPLFLEALAISISVMDAARLARVGHVTAYKERRLDPDFAASWDSIRQAKFYEPRICDQCSTEFQHQRTSQRPGRFCSKRCAIAHQRAEGEARALAGFWEKVDKNGPIPIHVPDLGPCWIWTAATDQTGYGMYRHSRSHRFAWELARGTIPEGLQVLHKCDNPPCVRMGHLFVGTLQANMADRNAKQRQARGELSGRAVLTEAQVLEARRRRANGELVKDLAEEFGVSPTTLSHATTGRSWRHVA